jgi:acyl-coenzyme A thioesterase PaaI-like protein
MRHCIRWLLWLWNFWPPFVGAGIRLTAIRRDLMGLEVNLKNRMWTRNPMGTQFGGAIFAMTDPFYVGIFRLHLDRDILVWDKAATIRFKSPSRAQLRAVFRITPEELIEVRKGMLVNDQLDWTKTVEITEASGKVVAVVDKTLAFRRKRVVAANHST